MNKQILIGSIIAVVILVLVSFTSVIGYRSISSDVKESPLFTVRTSRAVNKESKDLRCYYFGMGEESNIHSSSRMKRAEQVQKVVDFISKISDKTFSKFVTIVILQLEYQNQMTDKEISNVLQALYHIRINPNDNKYSDEMSVPFTLLICAPRTYAVITCEQTLEYITCHEFPCIYWTIYEILFFIMLIIIGRMIYTRPLSCDPDTCGL